MWPFNTKAKQPAQEKRGYKAAKSSRLAYDWITAPINGNDVLQSDLFALRARSRDAYQNEDYARRFVNLCVENIIGHQGFQLQFKAKNAAGKADTAANRILEAEWKRFSKRGFCDASGQLSMRQAQRLAVRHMVTDGEIFIRMLPGWKGNAHRFAIQLIDADYIDHNYQADLPNGNRVRMGVEFNEWSRPVAYHVCSEPVNSTTTSGRTRTVTRIPAEQMVHLFLPEFAGQLRGVPWMSSGLVTLRHLNGFKEAAIVAARAGAQKMGFLQDKEPPISEYGADDDEELELNGEAGTFQQIPSGLEFVQYDPRYPDAVFEPFIKDYKRSISAGWGVSYHTLANDLEGVNYTSSRTGELHDREVWKGLQTLVWENFLEIVKDAWLDNMLLTDATFLPAEKVEKFRPCFAQGRRWDWVDPKKDTEADKAQEERGVMSPIETIQKRGRDPEEVVLEIKTWHEMLEKNGIAHLIGKENGQNTEVTEPVPVTDADTTED